MARYVAITLILAGVAIGVTLYFMKGIEHETKKPEETATVIGSKPIVNKPKEVEIAANIPKEEPVEKPEVKETPKESPKPETDTKTLEKVKELQDKLSLLGKAGLAKADLEKIELNDPQKALKSAEEILIPMLMKKVANDSPQNDAVTDVAKFKESKLKEGETVVELPKAGEDKKLDDGTTISRKDEFTISVKTSDGKEEEYLPDNFLLVSNKDGKNSFRIIEDKPTLSFNDRLKAYLDTMVLILGKEKTLHMLDEKRFSEVDVDKKTRVFEAERLLY